MGTLFGFAVGYVMGARVGARGFEEVVAAFSAVRRSQEFAAFRQLALAHGRSVLAEVGSRLAGNPQSGTDALMADAMRRAQAAD